MKKIVAPLIIIAGLGLAGCNEEKVSVQSAPTITKEQVEQGNENIGKSIPLPTTVVIPEKGKYKY